MSAYAIKLWSLISKLPAMLPGRPNISKRSVLLVTSVGGVFALFITAIYMRRKRKPLPSVNSEVIEDGNKNIVHYVRGGKRKKRQKSRRMDWSMLNPQSSQEKYHRREHSMVSESSTVSSVRSSNSRRSRIHHLAAPGTKEYYHAEQFYKRGVDAFEVALTEWEKASAVLGSDDVSSGRSSSHSQHSRRTPHVSESNTPIQTTPRSRRSSTVKQRRTSDTPTNQNDVTDCGSGDHTLVDAEESSASEMEQRLLLFMKRAEKLQKTFEDVLYTSGSDTESDTDITLTGYDVDSDTASFVSAQEIWETRSLESPIQQHLALYEAALEAVDAGRVRCRTMRTEMLECFSDTEFLAKLHCVRQALQIMLEDSTVRNWLVEQGRLMIEQLLKLANHELAQFNDAYKSLMEYVSNEENWNQIEDELKGRKVVAMSFYDIVLDFIIMDSFDDLERPPSQLMTVLGNRWLTNSIKETALSTAVWSVLKAKSRMLRYQDGFIAKFYAVSETISPVLAWGFLGTDEKLKASCEKFKCEVLSFLHGMFSFDEVRYTTKEQMSDDILRLARYRIQRVFAHYEGKR